jgi:hypothetical protein
MTGAIVTSFLEMSLQVLFLIALYVQRSSVIGEMSILRSSRESGLTSLFRLTQIFGGTVWLDFGAVPMANCLCVRFIHSFLITVAVGVFSVSRASLLLATNRAGSFWGERLLKPTIDNPVALPPFKLQLIDPHFSNFSFQLLLCVRAID